MRENSNCIQKAIKCLQKANCKYFYPNKKAGLFRPAFLLKKSNRISYYPHKADSIIIHWMKLARYTAVQLEQLQQHLVLQAVAIPIW